ncbi:MAG: DUF58 domain-containing protein [Verrucomicrobiota bacterium]
MLPTDYIQRLRSVEVRARLVSEQLMGGRLGSVFKGRGMDFADVREYTPGDDVRRIDWNVTARLRKPFIKRHIEERELVVLLLVDISASGDFGSASDAASGTGSVTSQRELAAILAGSLAFSAVRNGDRVGAILFSDRVERYIPPRKTRAHVTRLLHEMLFTTPKHPGTSVDAALRFLNNLFSRPTLSFVLSDFHDPDTEGWTRAIKASNQRHEMIALRVTDRRELELPDLGWVLLQDPETGEVLEVDTTDPRVREGWRQAGQARRDQLIATFRSGRIPEMEIRTDEPWTQRLQGFLDHAARRRVA